MATGEFEIEAGVPSSALAGTINAEAHEPGQPPTRIFGIKDTVVVDCDWSLTGTLQTMIAGTWKIDLELESVGPGNEFEIPGGTLPVEPGGTGQYSKTIMIPPNTIVPAGTNTDIAYKMVVVLTYKDTNNKPGPIAGFVELPMVQFYQEH